MIDFLLGLLRSLFRKNIRPEINNLKENPSISKNEEKPMYDWSNLKPLDIYSTTLVQVPWLKYYREEFPKDQIVLHHTVSGPGIEGDLNTWKNFKSHIATCMIIERDGKINQLFSSKYWGYHLGVGKVSLDQKSIAVELDNWGGLYLGDGSERNFGKNFDGTYKIIRTIPGKFYTVYGNTVDIPVVYYPKGFRGYYYYEAYTYEQLKSLGELLLFWNKKYNISLIYNEDMWDVSQRALNGERGVWTHVSYRSPSEKQDCHPQPELIDLLKSLNKLV